MKKTFILLLVLSALIDVFAQDNAKKPDSTMYSWRPSLVTTLNFSQIAFSNWTSGGDNSMAWTVGETFGLKYKTSKWSFKNEVNSSYGQTKLGSNDFRVTDNEFFMESVLSNRLGWAVDPYISNTIRTQVTTGYEYTDTTRTPVSDFFDPGYITQSIGFTFDKLQNFQTRLGLAFEETFANNFTEYTDDSTTVDKVEDFKFETGLETVSDANICLDDNLMLKSKLRLFTAFERLDIWDVRWNNEITAKVNNWLDVNFNYLLVYQLDQSPTLQMKQSLQVGIAYTFL